MNNKTVLIISLLVVCIFTNAQKKQLVAKDTYSLKEVVFNEGKRVRIKTIQNGKLSGRLFFTEDGKIRIKSHVIPIEQIVKIKKNPLLLHIVTSSTCIFAGTALITGGLVGVIFASDTAASLAIIPGSGLIFLGVIFPNPLRACNMQKEYKLFLTNGSPVSRRD